MASESHSAPSTITGKLIRHKVGVVQGVATTQAVLHSDGKDILCIWRNAPKQGVRLDLHEQFEVTGQLVERAGHTMLLNPTIKHVPPLDSLLLSDAALAQLSPSLDQVSTEAASTAAKSRRFRLPKKVWIPVAALFCIFALGSGGGDNTKQPIELKNTASHAVAPASTETAAAKAAKSVATKAAPKPADCEERSVPFTSSTKQDGTLHAGQRKVTSVGVAGKAKDCYLYGRAKAPTTTIIGTYTAPKPAPAPIPAPAPTPQPASPSNGSGYTNSAGNYVQSPSNNPVGATAQCRDGSYSYSQSRSGTCSHHGGVSSWL